MSPRASSWFVALVLAACGSEPAAGSGAATAATPWSFEDLSVAPAIARAGCVRCHADADPDLAPEAGPALGPGPAWRQGDGAAAWLERHASGVATAASADLAAWLAAVAPLPETPPAAVSPAAFARGETLVRELACLACHSPADFASLPARIDHPRLAAALQQPAVRQPGAVHPELSADEAAAVAAWLLRTQRRDGESGPGFRWRCYELSIDDGAFPDLAAATPAASGTAMTIDAAVRTRDDHVAIEFDATLDVPTAGEWTFTVGSDDGSWLWLDDQLVVANPGLAPHRRQRGSVTLAAGPHALRVGFTQAAGGASLEVLWQGPGVEQEPLPASRASTTQTVVMPPPPTPPPDAAAVARGRERARALRCDACHAIADPAFAALPAPAPGKPWAALPGGPCPQARGAEGLLAGARALAARLRTPHDRLEQQLFRDGCLSCHARAGRGGLPAPVRQALAETEDLGDEGRLPPELTAAEHRLRPAWIAAVLRGERRARPYLRVRMPVLSPARAAAHAAAFAAAAAMPGEHGPGEPPFATEQIERGRELVSTRGKNCITCHPLGQHRALGPQGIDLGLLFERTQPGWFRDWLLQPGLHRPGTRMPTLWPVRDAAAIADADAIRTWSSLAAAAPVPVGYAKVGGLRLEPGERPLLHGAFLRGVSARCLAVGTPQRTHFAWNLASPQLVWLWRGDFLDGSGTWSGRAGELVAPAGEQHVVLAPLQWRDAAGQSLLPVLAGQRIAADGYPALQLRVGDAIVADTARPRFVAGGSELVRTLQVQGPACSVEFPPPTAGLRIEVGGAPAGRHELREGQALEVVYRW